MFIDNKKFCSKCNLYLSLDRFKKLTTKSSLEKYPDGYYWCCIDCYKKIEWTYNIGEAPNSRKFRRREKRMRRASVIEYTYGLKPEEYEQMVTSQKNLCAICGTKEEGNVLCIDHDHTTGKVRGLLCTNCNIGLGNLKDNVQIFQSAIAYLQKYGKAGDSTCN